MFQSRNSRGIALKVFFLSATFVFLIDRVSKYILLKVPYERIELLPFLALVKAWNKGIAFGIFHQASQVISLALLLFVPIVLIIIFFLAKKADRVSRILFGLIFGGGLGNWIDRITFGAVFDFIDLHLGAFHWPAFNLADLAITIGLIFFLIKYAFKNS